MKWIFETNCQIKSKAVKVPRPKKRLNWMISEIIVRKRNKDCIFGNYQMN